MKKILFLLTLLCFSITAYANEYIDFGCSANDFFPTNDEYIRQDGTTPLTGDWDAGAYTITADGFTLSDNQTITFGTNTLSHSSSNNRFDLTDSLVITDTVDGETVITVANGSAGTNAFSDFSCYENTNKWSRFGYFNSNWTTVNGFTPLTSFFDTGSLVTGGIQIRTGASAPIAFYTAGNNIRATINGDGTSTWHYNMQFDNSVFLYWRNAGNTAYYPELGLYSDDNFYVGYQNSEVHFRSSSTDIASIYSGGFWLGKNLTAGAPYFIQSGFISASGTMKYAYTQIDDSTDYWIFARQDSSILGMDIQMPLVTDNITSSGDLRVDGGDIGITADTDLMQLASGVLTITGQTNTQNVYPIADDTYYLGKNDDDTPFAWKGLILKDQTNGNYYRIELNNGSVTIVDLTD